MAGLKSVRGSNPDIDDAIHGRQLSHLLPSDSITPGHMMVMPYTCTSYQDFRGLMIYKNITGFVSRD